ncbi:MAG: hypothetical protein AUJ55_11900 [Proteobacteria bacterium CG1_02_64_396]|nr:MAG: hypothetical protein AUJ55_11900 [Proteobacteria bacterium CG1_02_64_396]
MTRYAYRTVTLEQKGSGLLHSRDIPGLEETLNREGKEGWHLNQVILPSAAFGESDRVVLVFDRPIEA